MSFLVFLLQKICSLRGLRSCTFLTVFLLSLLANAEQDLSKLHWLLDVDPGLVSNEDLLQRALELEENFQRFHQHNGILWTTTFANPEDQVPKYFGTGADNAIFTGFYLAAATYRFMVTNHEEDLDEILETLRGIHILTHISGIPGVLVRNAFPMEDAARWQFPKAWEKRIEKGFMYESSDGISDILNPRITYPRMIFYTKTTKDQLTGILFGLAVVLANLQGVETSQNLKLQQKINQCYQVIEVIVSNLYNRLKSKRFRIKDHENSTGTTASKVSGLLKLQVYAVYKETLRMKKGSSSEEYLSFMKTYRRAFGRTMLFDGWENFLQPLIGGYYAWNLRMARIFSIWILEQDPEKKTRLETYARRRIWRYIRHHENSHLIFLYNVVKSGETENLTEATLNLRRFYFRPMRSWSSPLAGTRKRPSVLRQIFRLDKKFVVPAHLRKFSRFFLWQKDPFKVGDRVDNRGIQRSPGLSFLLPYWMGRYYQFLPAP